jgi:hypothetical protein
MIAMTPIQVKQLDLMRQMERSFALGNNPSQIVNFQTDYATDDQICLTTVSFVSKDIADAIYEKIILPLQTIDPTQYYFPKESLHITVHNIRVIAKPKTYTEQDINLARKLLTQAIPQYTRPEFELRGIITMPTSIGIIALITDTYNDMVWDLRRQFAAAGLPDNKKYFTQDVAFANITICRYTHQPSQEFINKLPQYRDTFFGMFTANETSLIESNAGIYPAKTIVHETYQFHQ